MSTERSIRTSAEFETFDAIICHLPSLDPNSDLQTFEDSSFDSSSGEDEMPGISLDPSSMEHTESYSTQPEQGFTHRVYSLTVVQDSIASDGRKLIVLYDSKCQECHVRNNTYNCENKVINVYYFFLL